MSAYKVPQDVEAEDKLLGPFSFRQFVYLLVAFGFIGVGYVLSLILLPLALIPVPIVLLLFALALPLKKDQPMETYLFALFSFYFLKPRKRIWQPDGITALVEITAPKEVEVERTKSISVDEARDKLDYLTDIIDSRGWAVRGTGVPSEGVSSMHDGAYREARNTQDMLDDDGAAAQKFDQLISNQKQEHMSAVRDSMQAASVSAQQFTAMPSPYQQAPQQQPYMQQPQQNFSAMPQAQPDTTPPTQAQPSQPLTGDTYTVPEFDPYPDSIKQAVIQPLEDYTPMSSPFAQQTGESRTSITNPSPDIMRLVNETDGLTVASVAREAQRIEERQELTPMSDLPEGEVHISLR